MKSVLVYFLQVVKFGNIIIIIMTVDINCTNQISGHTTVSDLLEAVFVDFLVS